jgi:hypothetical protein
VISKPGGGRVYGSSCFFSDSCSLDEPTARDRETLAGTRSGVTACVEPDTCYG